MALGNRIGFSVRRAMSPREQLYSQARLRRHPVLEAGRGDRTGRRHADHRRHARIDARGHPSQNGEERARWKSCRALLREPKLEKVFPTSPLTRSGRRKSSRVLLDERNSLAPASQDGEAPGAVIPVFPGTNCEYDTARAFEQAGGASPTICCHPQPVSAPTLRSPVAAASPRRLAESADRHDPRRLLRRRRAGRLAASSSPPSSATRGSRTAIHDPVQGKRDGLMLGICNGFQALVKLGLVPFGEIRRQWTERLPDPDLQLDRPPPKSMMVKTRGSPPTNRPGSTALRNRRPTTRSRSPTAKAGLSRRPSMVGDSHALKTARSRPSTSISTGAPDHTTSTSNPNGVGDARSRASPPPTAGCFGKMGRAERCRPFVGRMLAAKSPSRSSRAACDASSDSNRKSAPQGALYSEKERFP